MAQWSPEPTYDHDLASRVTLFLHTGDRRLFPFTQKMDSERLAAFKRDLREGLGEFLDSGSARKTSATGYITSHQRLERIVQEWRAAGGGWPEGADPDALNTALAALDEDDLEDDSELQVASIEDDMAAWRGWKLW